MPRIIVLDSWPVGLASNARGNPEADHCRAWIDALNLAGALVVVPEIADFEVRGNCSGPVRTRGSGASIA